MEGLELNFQFFATLIAMFVPLALVLWMGIKSLKDSKNHQSHLQGK